MASAFGYIVLRVMSTLGGIAVTAIVAYLNVSKAAEAEGVTLWELHKSPVCMSILALACGSALVWVIMHKYMRDKAITASVVAGVGLLICEVWGLTLSAERFLLTQELRSQQAVKAGNPYAIQERAYERAVTERSTVCDTHGFLSKRCKEARRVEGEERVKLGTLTPPGSTNSLADAIGMSPRAADLTKALLGGVGLQLLSWVLLGFGVHGTKSKVPPKVAEAPSQPQGEEEEPAPDPTQRVVSMVRHYRLKHGRNPPIRVVQKEFNMPKTTAHRWIRRA